MSFLETDSVVDKLRDVVGAIEYKEITVHYKDLVYGKNASKDKKKFFFSELEKEVTTDDTTQAEVKKIKSTFSKLEKSFSKHFKKEAETKEKEAQKKRAKRQSKSEDKDKEEIEIQRQVDANLAVLKENYVFAVVPSSGSPILKAFFKETVRDNERFFLSGEEDPIVLANLSGGKYGTEVAGRIYKFLTTIPGVHDKIDVPCSDTGIYKEGFNPLSSAPYHIYEDAMGRRVFEKNTHTPPVWQQLIPYKKEWNNELPEKIQRFFELLCSENGHDKEILLDWISACFDSDVLGTYLLLLSGRGTGKTALFNLLTALFGYANISKSNATSNKDMFNKDLQNAKLKIEEDVNHSGTKEGFLDRKNEFEVFTRIRGMKADAKMVRRTYNLLISIQPEITNPRTGYITPTYLQTDERRVVMPKITELLTHKGKDLEDLKNISNYIEKVAGETDISKIDYDFLGQVGYFFLHRLESIKNTPKFQTVAYDGYKGGLFYTTCIKALDATSREIVKYLLYGEKVVSPKVLPELEGNLKEEERAITYEQAGKVYESKQARSNKPSRSVVSSSVKNFIYKGSKVFTTSRLKQGGYVYKMIGNLNIDIGEYGKE